MLTLIRKSLRKVSYPSIDSSVASFCTQRNRFSIGSFCFLENDAEGGMCDFVVTQLSKAVKMRLTALVG